MSSNPVVWFEIYVQDMGRAKAFYEAVFAVELEKLGSPGLEMWAFSEQKGDTGGAGAAGTNGALVRMPGTPSGGNSTLVYFHCADCAVEAQRAAKSGGKIFRDKISIGPYGFVAHVFDTEGNLIGLHSIR